jgi:hypothetical protein
MWRSRLLQKLTITSVLSFESGARMKRRDIAMRSPCYGVGSPASLGSSLQRIMQKILSGVDKCKLDAHWTLRRPVLTSMLLSPLPTTWACGSYLPGHTDVAEGLEACFSNDSVLS